MARRYTRFMCELDKDGVEDAERGDGIQACVILQDVVLPKGTAADICMPIVAWMPGCSTVHDRAMSSE